LESAAAVIGQSCPIFFPLSVCVFVGVGVGVGVWLRERERESAI
jgi:hypothetical protein